MRHNVNFGLLGLLLLVIMAMLGLVLYYYLTFEGLRSDYDKAAGELVELSVKVNDTQAELNEKEQQLNEKEKILLEYLGELNLSKQKATSITDHYTQMKSTADSLSVSLNSTVAEKERYAKLYDKYYTESIEWKGKYDTSKAELDSARNKISRMKGDATEISNSLANMEAELESLTNRMNSISSDASDLTHAGNTTSYIRGLANSIEGDAEASKTTVSAVRGYFNRIDAMVLSIRGS